MCKQEYEDGIFKAAGCELPEPAANGTANGSGTSLHRRLVVFWLSCSERQRARLLNVDSPVEVELVRQALCMATHVEEELGMAPDEKIEPSNSSTSALLCDYHTRGAVDWSAWIRIPGEEQCFRGTVDISCSSQLSG